METIQNMVNPFDCEHSELVHITSGVVALSEVEFDLMTDHSVGDAAFKEFAKERRMSNESDFFDALKK